MLFRSAKAWASEVKAAKRLGMTLAELKERMEIAQRLGMTLAELRERMELDQRLDSTLAELKEFKERMEVAGQQAAGRQVVSGPG